MKKVLQVSFIVVSLYQQTKGITLKLSKMTTEKFTLVRETEKAVLYIVGFKFSESRSTVVYGVDGNENLNTGYLVECWMPKSVIDTDGNIASWFSRKVFEAFGRFNPSMDQLYF